MNITKETALQYHEEGRPGKIEVIATKPASSQFDLSLAYTPGVAVPVLEIANDPRLSVTSAVVMPEVDPAYLFLSYKKRVESASRTGSVVLAAITTSYARVLLYKLIGFQCVLRTQRRDHDGWDVSQPDVACSWAGWIQARIIGKLVKTRSHES